MPDTSPKPLAAEAAATPISQMHSGLVDTDDTLVYLTPAEETKLMHLLQEQQGDVPPLSAEDARLLRKLKLSEVRRENSFPGPTLYNYRTPTDMLEPGAFWDKQPPPDTAIIDALDAVEKTPLPCSFVSRINGTQPSISEVFIHRDWESRTPWMDLMDDIRLHFGLKNPHLRLPTHGLSPIDYDHLRPGHLEQVHDLLWRTFWPGIDVTDCLDNSPELRSVVATCKRLVVGTAFLSSPSEGYLMYVAVRAGWDAAGIATFMLHHLITLNPNKDIILHVSADNPAMLLYNRFGFKAEEFVVGFYDEYLPRTSTACKNAFRMRLRR